MTAVATVTPARLTVTEALAEIKTLGKRIEKRRENVLPYLFRQKAVTDPLEEETGGSPEFIRRERQAIRDLETRLVSLRVAIQALNLREEIMIDGETLTMAEWLTWRKEVLPGQRGFLQNLRTRLEQMRREAGPKQVGVVNVDSSSEAKRNDVLVNISEAELAREIEHVEFVVGTLDGQLSLKNATTTIEVR